MHQLIKPSQRLAAARQPRTHPQSRREQYELLLPYYEEESERYEALNKRAAAYLSILGVVSAFAVFKAEGVSIHIFANQALLVLAGLTLFAVLGCVLTVSYATRITDYKTPIGPRELVLKVDGEKYTSEDTYSLLLAGLVDSIETNRTQNDKCANALQISLWFGAAAIVLFIALNTSLLFVVHKESQMTSKNTQGTNAPSPAPAPSSPGNTPMADLLNTTTPVPVQKNDQSSSPSSPAKKVK
jgi:hypothetical protein